MNSSIVYKPSLSSPCWPLFVQSCCFSWPIFDYARILGPYLWSIWNVVSWVFWYHFCGLCKFDYGRCDSFAWPWWKTAGQRHKTTRDRRQKKKKVSTMSIPMDRDKKRGAMKVEMERLCFSTNTNDPTQLEPLMNALEMNVWFSGPKMAPAIDTATAIKSSGAVVARYAINSLLYQKYGFVTTLLPSFDHGQDRREFDYFGWTWLWGMLQLVQKLP